MKKGEKNMRIHYGPDKDLDYLFERCVLYFSQLCLKQFVFIEDFLRPSLFIVKNIP